MVAIARAELERIEGQEVASGNSLLLDLDGTILEASAGALETLGLSRAAVEDRPFAALLESPTPAQIERLLARARKGRTVRTRARFAGGKLAGAPVPLWIRLSIAGAVCGVVVAWESARKNGSRPPGPARESTGAPESSFETLFQAYLELRESNRQKLQLLAATAHELKTPLAVIRGSCELLLSNKLGGLTPPQGEVVALTHHNCHRLINVVNSFLDFSAGQQGKLVLRLEKHSPAELLAETSNYWRRLADSRGVTLAIRPPELLPRVPCDRLKVLNVLNALLDNALKFTPRGGKIALSAESHFWDRRLAGMEIEEERRGTSLWTANAVKFSVSDTGPGIPAEYHQEIFEEYFQAPNAGTEGMGLGLAIARRIVAGHKGKIWVESQPQRGSTFSFLLPLGRDGKDL